MKRALALNRELLKQQAIQNMYETVYRKQAEQQRAYTATQNLLRQTRLSAKIENTPAKKILEEVSKLLDILLNPTPTSGYVPYEFSQEAYERKEKENERKKKKLRR